MLLQFKKARALQFERAGAGLGTELSPSLAGLLVHARFLSLCSRDAEANVQLGMNEPPAPCPATFTDADSAAAAILFMARSSTRGSGRSSPTVLAAARAAAPVSPEPLAAQPLSSHSSGHFEPALAERTRGSRARGCKRKPDTPPAATASNRPKHKQQQKPQQASAAPTLSTATEQLPQNWSDVLPRGNGSAGVAHGQSKAGSKGSASGGAAPAAPAATWAEMVDSTAAFMDGAQQASERRWRSGGAGGHAEQGGPVGGYSKQR